jgi:hypothetical protein
VYFSKFLYSTITMMYQPHLKVTYGLVGFSDYSWIFFSFAAQMIGVYCSYKLFLQTCTCICTKQSYNEYLLIYIIINNIWNKHCKNFSWEQKNSYTNDGYILNWSPLNNPLLVKYRGSDGTRKKAIKYRISPNVGTLKSGFHCTLKRICSAAQLTCDCCAITSAVSA